MKGGLSQNTARNYRPDQVNTLQSCYQYYIKCGS